MLKNYIITALRNIKRDLFYSGINILGLAIGMCCSILIMLWVYDEVSFDRYHEDSDLIYRIIAELPHSHVPVGSMPLAKSLKDEYPEVIESCNLFPLSEVNIKFEEKLIKNNTGLLTDPQFLNIFSYEIIEKQSDSLLHSLNEVILTKSLALKLFGNESPIGKIVTLNIDSEYIVSALIEDVPSNSHLTFDYIVNIYSNESFKRMKTEWGVLGCAPYIKISPNTNIDDLRLKVSNHYTKILGEEEDFSSIGLQALNDIHLKSSHLQELYASLGDIKYVKIFALVSIFILIIACINFMNLSTAKAAKRLTDVGIRKVVGAKRSQLIIQYLGESLLIAFIAMLFALLFVDFLLHVFNSISQKVINMSVFSFKEISWLIIITAVTGLFSGSYTAIYLSKVKSTQILSKEPIRGKKGKFFRHSLVVAQFTISIALIIVSLVIRNQLNYLQNKDLGYKIDNLVVLDLGGSFTEDYEPIKNRLLSAPSVKFVTTSSSLPVNVIEGTYGGNWPGRDPEERYLTNNMYIDNDYIDALGMQLIKGRNFDENYSKDSNSFIVNELAVKKMNLLDPIGTEITLRGISGKIIGVTKDFHYSSMHSPVGPIIMLRAKASNFLIVKIKTNDFRTTMEELRNIVLSNFPDYTFSYKTLSDRYSELYSNEKRIGKMFNYFALLAILLSCLGLFGLSAYSAEQKTKEIGIRKALGGSISSIILILEKEFIFWVLISNIIAWPVSYYFANKWLESFTYKVHISITTFIIAAALTLIIAISTVFAQAYRASRKNPTKSLRYE